MKTIEDYVQFAIENGFDLGGKMKNCIDFKIEKTVMEEIISFLDENNGPLGPINIIQLITSKEFIESIARGSIRKTFSKDALEENIQEAFKHSIFKNRVEKITREQAIAIRKGKIPFITNK